MRTPILHALIYSPFGKLKSIYFTIYIVKWLVTAPLKLFVGPSPSLKIFQDWHCVKEYEVIRQRYATGI